MPKVYKYLVDAGNYRSENKTNYYKKAILPEWRGWL
jgi:hypothetical protein